MISLHHEEIVLKCRRRSPRTGTGSTRTQHHRDPFSAQRFCPHHRLRFIRGGDEPRNLTRMLSGIALLWRVVI